MAKRRITWGKVKAGDVLQFRYKSPKEGSKSRLRTCLILNEKHMYQKVSGKVVRLVHALQLTAIPRDTGTKRLQESHIRKLFIKAGKMEIRAEGEEDERYAIQGSRFKAAKQYGKLRNLVTQYGNYRTFSWQRLKTKACFLDDEFIWPEDLVREFQKRKPEVNEEEI